ncbi:MAG: hypothetical protein AVDCRST_MAG87-1370 [uncultured Thermomicrobiales bacterium]|uniref:2TM domain-containing protein n=1 Tax=uncultured Thermomicrobiales bacterium TaxID=1645740 RepID=A0A6J4UU02_9BACT|nr:MAG: hypothetical protein AVDCRST_MAG87-1370 [uncultured Thermomicrobiales bacterium]
MTDQHPAAPTRPFESLDWYRQASRSGSGSLGAGGRFLDWARGIGFLSLHVSMLALGSVAMFVVNLLRSPERIWVDRAIPIWTLIVIIHAVLVGLLWAIGQLNREDDGPLLVVSDARWRAASTWAANDPARPPTGGAPSSGPSRPEAGAETTMQARPAPGTDTQFQRAASPAPPGEPGVATTTQFRPSASAPESTRPPVSPAHDGSASRWSGWESDVPQPAGSGDLDRASWQEAAAAARRGRSAASTPPPPPAAPQTDVANGS